MMSKKFLGLVLPNIIDSAIHILYFGPSYFGPVGNKDFKVDFNCRFLATKVRIDESVSILNFFPPKSRSLEFLPAKIKETISILNFFPPKSTSRFLF